MAKIETYATTAPALTDILLGSDVNAANATKNFTVESIVDMVSTATIPLSAYASDAAAGAAGVVVGQLWQTTAGHSLGVAGIVMVKQ
jgi:NADPH-dependent curcumin reductase CurA